MLVVNISAYRKLIIYSLSSDKLQSLSLDLVASWMVFV